MARITSSTRAGDDAFFWLASRGAYLVTEISPSGVLVTMIRLPVLTTSGLRKCWFSPEEYDSGTAVSRDVDHHRALRIQDVIAELPAEVLAFDHAVVGTHGPSKCGMHRMLVSAPGDRKQIAELFVRQPMRHHAQGRQCLAAEGRAIAGRLYPRARLPRGDRDRPTPSAA